MKIKLSWVILFGMLIIFFGCATTTQNSSIKTDPLSSSTVEPIQAPPLKDETVSNEVKDRDIVTAEPAKVKEDEAIKKTVEDKAVRLKDSPSSDTFSGSPSASKPSVKSTPTQSGLKAGYSDDNQQFNYFVNFLDTYAKTIDYYPLKITERIILNVVDTKNKPIANAPIEIKGGNKSLARGVTMPDGSFSVYPLEIGGYELYTAEVRIGNSTKTIQFKRTAERKIVLKLDINRTVPKIVPLDIVFVMDTTGSMGEEIARLRDTIEIIYTNLELVQPKPAIRFGMVLYKDVGDEEYVVKKIPFTKDLTEFQNALNLINANGGGDTPEDLQAALDTTVNEMGWEPEGVRLAFVVTDAPPHLDYGQTYTYAQAARDAKAKGIKIFTIGTGGLPLQGEYILRQISQFTSAKYIFLTFGESGESEGGTIGAVSHHTGSNFTTDKLETIIMKFAREEMSYLTDTPFQKEEEYFDAQKISTQSKEATLTSLFTDALTNLIDYSTLKITNTTKVAFLPIELSTNLPISLSSQAEYFSEHELFTAQALKSFVIIERKDLQKILKEIEIQFVMLSDEERTIKLGNILGADVLVTGTFYKKDTTYEIYLKLLRVETGEILSITKLVIDIDLGL